jgi:hypothetical protein
VLLLSLFGCEAEDPCDAGERHEQGVCVPDTAGSGAAGKGAKAEAGSAPKEAAGSTASSACDADADAVLGNQCSADTDCNCAAPYCAKMPGQSMGFCTMYCEPDPDDCPSGYSCFDLSKLGVSGYDPFCVMMK